MGGYRYACLASCGSSGSEVVGGPLSSDVAGRTWVADVGGCVGDPLLMRQGGPSLILGRVPFF